VLLPFQNWGIAFDFLAEVGIKLGPDVSAQAGLPGWRMKLIVLGYQVGNLIFPSIVPVVLWSVLPNNHGSSPNRKKGATSQFAGCIVLRIRFKPSIHFLHIADMLFTSSRHHGKRIMDGPPPNLHSPAGKLLPVAKDDIAIHGDFLFSW
jgi:hypothetical protein